MYVVASHVPPEKPGSRLFLEVTVVSQWSSVTSEATDFKGSKRLTLSVVIWTMSESIKGSCRR
jgi:hypothetical protein